MSDNERMDCDGSGVTYKLLKHSPQAVKTTSQDLRVH